MFRTLAFGLVAVSLAPLGCSSSSSSSGAAPHDAGPNVDSATPPVDAGADAPAVACSGPCPASNIKYVVVLVMENHTFDDHFGAYCTAATGSNPTCNTGPSCCEAAPAMDPSGASPIALDDAQLGAYLPNNDSTCETSMIDGDKMDHYVAGASCSNPQNWVESKQTLVQPYWDLAGKYALADRYFQPMIGASSGNDMFLARAGYVFSDNREPTGAVGAACELAAGMEPAHTEKTIGDLLNAANVPWSVYAEGYGAQATAAAANMCATGDPNCPGSMNSYPCVFDPGDIPFEYYGSTRDKPANMKDLSQLATDAAAGKLPAVSFVKPIGYKTGHPFYGDTLTDAVTAATSIISQLKALPQAPGMLILMTFDESGGFYDHVTPPSTNPADNMPYGPRVPLLAVGPFVKTNYVSHVTMEHSSIVKFIEWNWLGMQTGQLMTRDTNVNDIGDLLDPAKTGATVPSN